MIRMQRRVRIERGMAFIGEVTASDVRFTVLYGVNDVVADQISYKQAVRTVVNS